jgi:hypothetical protein
MIEQFTSADVMEANALALSGYADLIVDHDPDDGDHVVPGELRRFLARLRLLHGVPFSYLVPDADLLPIESIRFFYVDRAWTDAMVQGVLSVGTITTADRTQLEQVHPHIRDDVDETERTIRTPLGEERLTGAGGTITGFLMRSRVVSGWPNLHVRAYSRDVLDDDALTTEAESSPDRMKVLRMERLAPAVLLVLFDGVPAVVHVEEPRQGIQFGVRLDPEDPPAQRRAKIKVRDRATGDPVPPQDDFVDANSIDVPFRPGAPGVINVGALRERLRTKAPTNGVVGSSAAPLEPNDLGLETLRFPFRQVFGDPDDTEQLKFFDLDAFSIEVSLEQWTATVAAHLTEVDR